MANASTWGAAVDGNVFVFGSDEQFHLGQGGQTLMNGAAPFSVAEAGKTGAYVSMSCYYHGTAAGTAIPLLDGAFGAVGDFTMTGVGCFNDAHITATHPAFTSAGVTDATLSGWGCSVHEAFDSWPVGFEVLAIADNFGAAYTAPDGSVGTPYVLARGVTVISDIDLGPDGAINPVGTPHTVTANVTTDDPTAGTPVVGTTVTFEIMAGPHVGATSTDVTDGSGSASFTYIGTSVGIDTIQATFVDSLGRTQRSNRVTKEWVITNADPDCSTAGPSEGELWPPNHQYVPITVSGATDSDGDTVVITVTGIFQDEAVDAAGSGNTSPDGVITGSDSVEVRAERVGDVKTPGDGRAYHILFTGDDGNGGTCSGDAVVQVPHDQGKNTVFGDQGPLFDSTAP